MLREFRKIASAVGIGFICALAVGLLLPDRAEAETVEDGVITVNVVEDYGADPSGQTDSTEAFVFAMNRSRLISDRVAADLLRVIIPPGTYRVKGFGVYSDTEILAEGAAIIGDGSREALVRGVYNKSWGESTASSGCALDHDFTTNEVFDYEEGAYYYIGGYGALKNITIDGGVWDTGKDDKAHTGIQLCHGQDITLRNLTVLHANFHMIDLSGDKNVLVENVTCRDAVPFPTRYTENFLGEIYPGEEYLYLRTLEAIHLGCPGRSKTGAYPRDATPPANVLVTGCTFDEVPAGVGSYGDGENIRVENCVFNNLRCRGAASQAKEYGNALNIYNVNGLSITGNKAANVRVLANIRMSSDADVSGNRVSNARGDGIYLYCTRGEIRDNTILEAAGHGIYARGKDHNGYMAGVKYSTVRIEGNTSISKKNIGSKYDFMIDQYGQGCTLINNTYGYRGIYTVKGTVTANRGNRCGVTKASVARAKVTKVSAKTYTGKALTQNPIVKLGGKTLKKGRDYTLSYSNNVSVGKATVTIRGKGLYGGTISKTYRINPKGTALTGVKPARKGFKAAWKKQSLKMKTSVISGYQIQYSRSKSFKKAKIVTVRGYGKTSLKVGKLAKKKVYYVRVRTFKKVKGVNYFSGWSKVKAVKTR